MSTCGCLSQLEVCKLLQCGDHVVCPGGLNGGLEPMWLTFPESALCPWQTHPQVIAITGEPLQHEAKRWGSHHPGPHHSFNATLLHAPQHGASQWDSYQHNCRTIGTTFTGHNWSLRPSPRVYCPKEVAISHSVKVQVGWLCYWSYNPAVDNSDSPSIVEQLSQGLSFSFYTFISDSFLVLWCILCLMPGT